MLIMVDTNVLISAFLFPTPRMAKLIDTVTKDHRLVLCYHIIDELHVVVNRKFRKKADQLDGFLYKLRYELVYIPESLIKKREFEIRDKNDYPILIAAIMSDVDVLITGDKDFCDVDIEKPEILTPAEFIASYC